LSLFVVAAADDHDDNGDDGLLYANVHFSRITSTSQQQNQQFDNYCARGMGASGSMEQKSPRSLKNRSADVASTVDQPQQNGTLTVVQQPAATSSTPSSPNRDLSLRRKRSNSTVAGRPASDTEAGDVDDSESNDRESIGFSLVELASYCNEDGQTSHVDERTCKSRDRVETSGSEPATEKSSASLQMCGVKPPVIEQPGQKAAAVDESPQSPGSSSVASTKSNGSLNSQQQQPKQQRPGSGGVKTGAKMRPRLGETQSRPSSEAITEIIQAKKLTHRAVVSRSQKTATTTQWQKQNEQPAKRPNGTASRPSSKYASATKSQQSSQRGNSGRGSRAKMSEQQTRQSSQTAAATTTGNPKSTAPIRQNDDPPEPPRYEMNVVVPSITAADAAPPSSNVDQSSTSTEAEKSAAQKAQPPQPVMSDRAAEAADDDDDDDDDWENMITALRDPDDIRNRKTDARSSVSWKSPRPKPTKPAKEEKKAENDNADDEEKEVNVCHSC